MNLLIRVVFTFLFFGIVGKADFDVNIIHFNDFHARFEETSKKSTKCIPSEGECIGGFPRLYTAINRLKAREPESLVLYAGDSYQGTLWYNILRWNVTQYFMNMLPIDAHALGNHEFDSKIEGLVPYLRTLKAPMLACNIDDDLEPKIQGLYNKSMIVERQGERIGIIGVIAARTFELSYTGKLKFIDEPEAVKKEAESLAQQGVNKIFVVSHAGLNVDRRIAQHATSYVDVIVGGHSHTLLYTGSTPSEEIAEFDYPVVEQSSGNTVLIVQASAYTKYLGELRVTFDDNGKITNWTGAPHYLDHTFEEDTKILELLKPFKESIDVKAKRVIGYSNVYLNGDICLTEECNLGNLITDAYVEYINKNAGDKHYVEIGVCNSGGIRADINNGTITFEDLIIAQPFNNLIQTFDLKGKHVLETVEHGFSQIGNKTWSIGAILQVSGLRIVYDDKRPSGGRVVEISVRCNNCSTATYEPLELEKYYKVAGPSYIANGGAGYTTISKNKVNVEPWATDDVIIEEYITANSPINLMNEGRVVKLQNYSIDKIRK